jgi:hypothetical protein
MNAANINPPNRPMKFTPHSSLPRCSTDLFDCGTDPQETKNLATDRAQTALVKQLAANLRRDAHGCERLFGK